MMYKFEHNTRKITIIIDAETEEEATDILYSQVEMPHLYEIVR